MNDLNIIRLDDGTIVSDYDDNTANRQMFDNGYEIKCIVDCHDLVHSVIYWQVETANAAIAA